MLGASVDNPVQDVKVPTAPCLKYFNQVTGNFPSLRAAIRSMGLEPTFIHVERSGYGFSEKTIVLKVELSHDHLPEFYRGFIKDDSDFSRIFLVARTKVYYTPKKHLVFLMDNDRWGKRDEICWLDPKREAFHLDLATNEWSLGRGKRPQLMSDI